jgi:hypothetical protein
MDDAALIATYEAFDTPVDQFIGNPGLAEAFATALRNRADTSGLDLQEIMHRLVYLRKRGRLPRLRRNYYGRNGSNN